MISCHISGCYGQCWCGLRVTRHFAIIQRVLAKIEDNGNVYAVPGCQQVRL